MGCCGDRTEPERVDGKIPGYGENDGFDGPMQKRGCTDVICLLIFLAYLGGMVAVFAMAIAAYGDPYRLFYGYDVKGDTCGRKNDQLDIYPSSGQDLSDRPYLHFDIARTGILFLPQSEFDEFGINVDKNVVGDDKIEYCLTGNVTYSYNDTTTETTTEVTEKKEEAITEDILASGDPINTLLTGGDSCRKCVDKCPDNHTSIFYRCVPDTVPSVATATAETFLQSSGTQSLFEEIVADVEASWKEIIYMSLVALGLSIIMVILFRFLAGVIVYVIITIIALAAILGPAATWYIWYVKKRDFDQQSNDNVTATTTTATNTTTSKIEGDIHNTAKKVLPKDLITADTAKEVRDWLIIAIVVSIVSVIILLILLVLRKRIKLVVQLFKEAGKAVQCMPFILIQPFWTFLSLAILAALWTLALAYIETAGIPEISSNEFVRYVKSPFWFWIRLYHLFGLLWLANFIVACQHMVIAGAVAGWYFTRDKSDLKLPILGSFKRLVIYHLGTVAFGSFIIALVQLVRMILAYIERKLAKRTNACGPLLKCCQCVLWCFEKCLKFLNRNAYIMTAIYGYNFCKAAQKAFSLLTSNILRVAAINSVGTFVLFLGKVAVVASTVIIGMQIMQYTQGENMVKHGWAPTLLAAIFAYMIIDCFVGVYGMAIDTIFLSFCEDSERNDGITKPYYMSVGLMEFVENSSKALAAMKKRQEVAASNNPAYNPELPAPQNNNEMPNVA